MHVKALENKVFQSQYFLAVHLFSHANPTAIILSKYLKRDMG